MASAMETDAPDNPVAKLVEDLKVLDKNIPEVWKKTREAFSLSEERVKRLDSSLKDSPTDKFFPLPLMKEAGLSTEGADVEFAGPSPFLYRRGSVDKVWDEIDKNKNGKILFIRGQPGTGKSTAIWRKVLSIAANGSNVFWVSLNRLGQPASALYFQGLLYYRLPLRSREIDVLLFSGIPLDCLVVDGINDSEEISKDIITSASMWVERVRTETDLFRTAILSSSSKVKEMRPHQNTTIKYLTVHSWQFEEYCDAMVLDGKPTVIYEQMSALFREEFGLGEDEEDEDSTKSEIEDSSVSKADGEAAEGGASNKRHRYPSGDDILAAIGAKYKWSGGSARWMFNYSRKTIDGLLRNYCTTSSNRKDILNGTIGPTSSASTNYFFGSAETSTGVSEYFLVSQRAIEILAEFERGTFEVLYSFAASLDNPSFEGWIVESDFFFQVDQARKHDQLFKPRVINRGRPFKPVSMLPYKHTANNKLLHKAMHDKKPGIRKKALESLQLIAASFVPTAAELAIGGKPSMWNQGGYDVFFVELVNSDDSKTHINIRFVQVTKGRGHDLKVAFLLAVTSFFAVAGYMVDHVEIAFMLIPKNTPDFRLTSVVGERTMKDFGVYNTPNNKWDRISDSTVSKYELTPTRT